MFFVVVDIAISLLLVLSIHYSFLVAISHINIYLVFILGAHTLTLCAISSPAISARDLTCTFDG